MRAAVVGRPIAHSLSPLIHNAWIETLGLPATYEALEPGDDGFEELITRLLYREGYVGVNVTAPFKERAWRMMGDFDCDPALANANVLRPDHGLLLASNTDGAGLVDALQQRDPGLTLHDRQVVILGAGSAARTAAITLDAAGAKILIANRSLDRAEALAAEVGAAALQWSAVAGVLRDSAVLINATSAVHAGERLDVDLSAADVELIVQEMSYRPLQTPLLSQAVAAGLRTVDGLAMLIGQARPSFEMFFGVAPPPAEVVDVRALCLRALGEA